MTSSSTQLTINPTSPSIPQETIPDAAAVYAHEMFSLVNHEDIINILQTQEDIQARLGQSAHSLQAFNEFSECIFNNVVKDYEKHTRMMREMTKDIDNIFRRIRVLRRKFITTFPDICPPLREDEDEEMM